MKLILHLSLLKLLYSFNAHRNQMSYYLKIYQYNQLQYQYCENSMQNLIEKL